VYCRKERGCYVPSSALEKMPRALGIHRVLRGTHRSKHSIRWVFQGVVDNLGDIDLIKEGTLPEEFHEDYRRGNPDWERELDEETPVYPDLRRGYTVRAVTNSVYNCTYCLMEPDMGSYKMGEVEWVAQKLGAFAPPILLMCEEHWFDFIKENQPSR